MSLTPSAIKPSSGLSSFDFRPDVIHQVVTAYLSTARQGSSQQKTRSDVRGGGKKPWRQKGTGRARAGTIRSPLWRGGGVTFASRPRDYTQKVNKKVYRLAMKSLLSELFRQNLITVIDEFKSESISTKEMKSHLEALGLNDCKRVLIVDEILEENAYLSSRNLVNVLAIEVMELNPFFLSSTQSVVITNAALKQLEERFAS